MINKAILLTHEVYVRLLYLIKCLISPAHQVCFVLLLTFLKYLKIFSPYKLILRLVTIETNILSDKCEVFKDIFTLQTNSDASNDRNKHIK